MWLWRGKREVSGLNMVEASYEANSLSHRMHLPKGESENRN